MEVLVKTTNLTKVYKETVAVSNLNMTINKGEIYGFIGENGAGKSTVIKLLTNIVNPTSGSYQINIDKRIGNIAAIVENPAIHNSLNALNNMVFQAKMLGLKKSVEELKELLIQVGLEDVIHLKKRAKNFSLGMKQRLSIALALISEPEFILLDEPMNGLDPLGIRKMRDLIIFLNKERNITFLISSHILTELDKVATRYGFISKGKLIKEITQKELHKLNVEIEDYYLEIVEGIKHA
ncbi:MAG: ATP-binding cassette domain-containing protein [Acholeplasmataceae bacterium]|jgi:ABC-2 type transport system ATP-binding protein|nr:ATP-binding cassette domain-containing protein [Acholeplasmataceae bacterium]MDD4090898.1 ATP-binding cassette domain-containing protein [Acholeplasmataceae bacterium]